jgi:muconate cycloisomerase
MIVDQVEYWKVVVPCKPDTINSPSIYDPLQRHDPNLLSFDLGHKWILRLRSSTGHFGIGETGRSESEDAVKACVRAVYGFDVRQFKLNCLPLPENEATYAFEVALLDLIGHIWEVPVHHLLGGKVRERVPVDYWMGRCTVEDTERRARTARELGFHGVKIKCTVDDPVAERVNAIQESLPHATVTIDPNERFHTPAETVAVARQLAGRSGIIFESPVPQERLDWYVSLRQEIEIPIALHLIGVENILEGIKRDAADYYNVSSGSPSDFVFCARLCDAAGHRVWHGSRMELGILDMAHIHAAAAAPSCTLPSDIVGNLMRQDDLLVQPICVEDGQAIVPDKPGLGVELDWEALERYRVE